MLKPAQWSFSLLCRVVVIGSIGTAGWAHADDVFDEPSEIYELIQTGQDVSIRLGVPDTNINSAHDLIRRKFELSECVEELPVLEDYHFSKLDAVDTFTQSLGAYGEVTWYIFDVIDECVPAEDFNYRFATSDYAKTKGITVEDTGDQCLEQYGMDPEELVVSAGDGIAGCSAGGLGNDTTRGALGLLMLGIGLAGLLVSRRRR